MTRYKGKRSVSYSLQINRSCYWSMMCAMKVIVNGEDQGWARCEYCGYLLAPFEVVYLAHLKGCGSRLRSHSNYHAMEPVSRSRGITKYEDETFWKPSKKIAIGAKLPSLDEYERQRDFDAFYQGRYGKYSSDYEN